MDLVALFRADSSVLFVYDEDFPIPFYLGTIRNV